MEDHKLQALHDTLSKLRGRHGLGTSSLYSWQNNSSQAAAAKAPPSGSGGNPLQAHFHREGEHPHRSLARGDGDGRAIKRNFDDLEESNRSSPIGDDGRKGKKKRKASDKNDKKKMSKEEKKMEKKAALKAAKLEMKRQAKLEEKRREKQAAKAKLESASPAGANVAKEPGKVDVESQPSPPDGDRSHAKEMKRKSGKKKSEKKEKKRKLLEEQNAGESSSPVNRQVQSPPTGKSKKEKRKV
jgi:hypothetical protein